MLLVKLTALVVWLAQYVSAADEAIGPLVPGDVVSINQFSSAALILGDYYLDPDDYGKETGISLTSDSSVKFCPVSIPKQLVASLHRFPLAKEFRVVLLGSDSVLRYYVNKTIISEVEVKGCK